MALCRVAYQYAFSKGEMIINLIRLKSLSNVFNKLIIFNVSRSE